MYLAADSLLCLPLDFLQTRPKVIAALGNDAASSEMARTIKEMLPLSSLFVDMDLRISLVPHFTPLYGLMLNRYRRGVSAYLMRLLVG